MCWGAFLKQGRKITLRTLLHKYELDTVKINLKFAEAELRLNTADEDAAWELYVEMLTRVVTQPLPTHTGDEMTALKSLHSLFGLTRLILRKHGRRAINFSKVAVPVLNQVVRPFTTKWHRESLANAFDHETKRIKFRDELKTLQNELRNYNSMLAEIAGVEDLSELEREAHANKLGNKCHG